MAARPPERQVGHAQRHNLQVVPAEFTVRCEFLPIGIFIVFDVETCGRGVMAYLRYNSGKL